MSKQDNITSLEGWAAARCLLMAAVLWYVPCKTPAKGFTCTFFDRDSQTYQNWHSWAQCYRDMKWQYNFLQMLQKQGK